MWLTSKEIKKWLRNNKKTGIVIITIEIARMYSKIVCYKYHFGTRFSLFIEIEYFGTD